MTDPVAEDIVLIPGDDGHVVVIADQDSPLEWAQVGSRIATELSPLLAKLVPEGRRAMLFETTPEIEALLGNHATHDAATAGFMLPVVCGDDGKWLRQIPLRQVSPFRIPTDPVTLVMLANNQLVLAKLDRVQVAVEYGNEGIDHLIRVSEIRYEAALTVAVDDVDQAWRRGGFTPCDWNVQAVHGTTIEAGLRAACGELESLGQTLRDTRWRAQRIGEMVERIASLVKLALLLARAYVRWCQLAIAVRPSSERRQRVADDYDQRIRADIEMIRRAIEGLPVDQKQGFHLGDFAKGGLKRVASKNRVARRHQSAVSTIATRSRLELADPPLPTFPAELAGALLVALTEDSAA